MKCYVGWVYEYAGWHNEWMRSLDEVGKEQIREKLERHPSDDSAYHQRLGSIDEIEQSRQKWEREQAEIFAYINTFNGDEVYAYLHELHTSGGDDVAVAWLQGQAFEAIIQLSDRDPQPFLLDSLRRVGTGWEYAACRALGEIAPKSEHIQILCQLLAQHDDGDMRFCAADALEKVGDTSALPTLHHSVEHDKGEDYEGWPVSGAAKKAIEAINSRQT